MSIPHHLAQPGIHQSNGIIQRCNSDVLAGARTLLVEAGLPSCFWPYAAACYCHHDNIQIADDGYCPWYRRFGEQFPGETFPFGSRVYFLPAPTKYELSKADARMQCGIFLGYEMTPGMHWSGKYYVADLDDFARVSLDMSAHPCQFRRNPMLLSECNKDRKEYISRSKRSTNVKTAHWKAETKTSKKRTNSR